MGFFSNRRNKIIRRNNIIKEEIRNSLLSKVEWHDTNIHWEAFVRFAQKHGGRIIKYSDGGQDTAFKMRIAKFGDINEDYLKLLNAEPWLVEVKVMAVRDKLDGTTSIKVEQKSYE